VAFELSLCGQSIANSGVRWLVPSGSTVPPTRAIDHEEYCASPPSKTVESCCSCGSSSGSSIHLASPLPGWTEVPLVGIIFHDDDDDDDASSASCDCKSRNSGNSTPCQYHANTTCLPDPSTSAAGWAVTTRSTDAPPVDQVWLPTTSLASPSVRFLDSPSVGRQPVHALIPPPAITSTLFGGWVSVWLGTWPAAHTTARHWNNRVIVIVIVVHGSNHMVHNK